MYSPSTGMGKSEGFEIETSSNITLHITILANWATPRGFKVQNDRNPWRNQKNYHVPKHLIRRIKKYGTSGEDRVEEKEIKFQKSRIWNCFLKKGTRENNYLYE